MAFAANPLALSVPEPAFESWLRDSGYLDILDQKTSDLHRISTTTTATTSTTTNPSAAGVTTTAGFFLPYLSCIGTLLSLFTFNPFSKLTADDFNGDTPSWTTGFVGSFGSYSLPSSPSLALLRVHENVKRYARNCASLFILFFACSLYALYSLALSIRTIVYEQRTTKHLFHKHCWTAISKFGSPYRFSPNVFLSKSYMAGPKTSTLVPTNEGSPLGQVHNAASLMRSKDDVLGPSSELEKLRYQIPLALVGSVSSLALWDAFRVCGERWGIDRHPLIRQTLVLVAQISEDEECGIHALDKGAMLQDGQQKRRTSSLKMRHPVLILHASFRKLTPAKQPAHGRRK
ncbi:hypothetical protein RJ639_039611 [Escallonia herrerae]|uniref:Uncharacterized protein n=1 Tax=Escallonia herrerae TaxID=1293975 RepID=A0AA88WI99_9ASTE|nr:hypothetical protein RJ639_039611 [Escallonia herrerae]